MPTQSLDQTLETALQHHQAGQFAEAETLYRQVLTQNPAHPGALHLLGVLAFQHNRPDIAVDLIRQSLTHSPNSAQAHGNFGLALAALGRYDEAIASYRRALHLKPDFLDARNNLGAALQETGHHQEAIEAFQQALQLNPNAAGALSNLATTLQAVGKIDDAIEHFRRAIQLDPNIPEAHNNLGNAFRAKGLLDQAIPCYQAALAIRPDFVQVMNNLAVCYLDKNDPASAILHAKKAIALQPKYAEAPNTLANILRAQKDFPAAIAAYQQSLLANPQYAEAHNNLGVTYHAIGEIDEAVASLQTAAILNPNSAEIQNNFGCALRDKNQHPQALAAFEKAVALKPDLLGAIQNLGLAYRERARIDDAITCYQKALQLKPNDPQTINDLANTEKDRGNLDLSLSLFRQAHDLSPDDSLIHSNLLYSMHFSPDYDAPAILKEHLAWADHQSSIRKDPVLTPKMEPLNNRRIRIGYVSPDLRGHVVGRHMLPLLSNHDRTQFEITCYTDVRQIDTYTHDLRQNVDKWRNIIGLTSAQFADLVRSDQIDILIDLTLHAAGTRLLGFALKPAPVQMTWLGYCSTTGLKEMDYRLSDPHFDPPGTDANYVEKTVRLPRTYWCYQPAGPTPDPSALPAQQLGRITFGCLNNFAKVSTAAFNLWLELLKKIPNSRLILHTGTGSHRDAFLKRATDTSLAPDQIIFFNGGDWSEYTAVYNQIDIVLDPFPYAGGITTMDALWMGVPVVTLIGQTAVGRGGASILSNLNLPDLIAETPQQYLKIAAALANDIPRMIDLRKSLRDRMKNSPLMDAKSYAADFETIYRDLVQKYLDEHPA